MIGRWITHALIYLSTCTMFSLVWVVLSGGTVDELRDYAETPADALTASFWPVWFWLIWGSVLAMHLAIVIGRMMPGRRRRHRQKKAIGEQARKAVEAALPDMTSALFSPTGATPATPATPPTPPAPPGRAASPSGRRYVVAMFTDLTGSTTANERLGDEAWATLVSDHRRVVRACTADHDGTEVSTQGDGFFVRFDQPSDAVKCAVDIQERFKVERSGGSAVPPVRIGIHVGDAMHEDDDVLGQVVNVAARLLEIAAPHEVLMTEPVADVVGADQLADRGLVTLKGMTQPRHVLALRWNADEPTPPARPARKSGRLKKGRQRGSDRSRGRGRH